MNPDPEDDEPDEVQEERTGTSAAECLKSLWTREELVRMTKGLIEKFEKPN